MSVMWLVWRGVDESHPTVECAGVFSSRPAAQEVFDSLPLDGNFWNKRISELIFSSPWRPADEVRDVQVETRRPVPTA